MNLRHSIHILSLLCWMLIVSGFGSFSHATSVRDSLLNATASTDVPEEKGDYLFALSRYYRRINLDSSAVFVREALEIVGKAGLQDKVQRYKMSQAALFWMQSKLDEAKKNYREALAYWRKKGNKTEVTRCLLNLGTVTYSSGTPRKAIDYLSEARSLAQSSGAKLMEAQSSGTIANVFYSLEMYDSALHYRLITLESFATLKDTANLVRSETNLGFHFRELGQSHRSRSHYLRAIEYLVGVDNKGLTGEVYEGLGHLEYRSGNLEAAVKYLLRSRKYFRELGWNNKIAYNNILVGLCFKMLGRAETAKEQFEASFQLADSIGDRSVAASAITNLGELQRENGKYREAIRHYREALQLSAGDTVHLDNFSRFLGLGLSMKALGMADSAEYYLGLAFEAASKRNNHFELGSALQELAAFAFAQDNFRECVQQIDSALKWYSIDQHSRGLHDAFKLKSECLEKMGDFVGALAAQREAAHWRDSIYSADVTESLLALEAQLWSEKKQHSLDLARTEQELKTKEAQIALNDSERLAVQRNWLISIFVLLLIVGTLLFYVNRKRRQNEMKGKITELRIAALRSQMNPHFIFNALGSVQLLINTQKSREANMYLSKFARMLRMILENSDSPTLSLEEELEALKLYVQLEALRFKFEYQFEVDEELSTSDIQLPNMLIQPFVENAIKHGISGKNQEGRLKITFSQSEGNLLCTVEDNGIGRAESRKIKRGSGGHHSKGIGLIRDQLDLVRPYRKDRLKIIDLMTADGLPGGTRVEILLELSI